MAKYFKASDYYPDDKDIYDFLDSQTRSIEPMARYLISRNIFSSKIEEKVDLQKYISLLYFDWESIKKLIDLVNIREIDEKKSHSKIEIEADFDSVYTAINNVKDERHNEKREVYQIKKNNGGFDVDVSYIDIDCSKTSLLQRREKELHITAAKTEIGWDIRYTNNDRSKSIIDDIKEEIKNTLNQDNIIEKVIDISCLKDHKKRVEFFKEMMMKMEGLQLIDVSNLKVDRIPDEVDGDDIESERTEIIDKKLKKVVMYGADLFTVREFQNLVSDGFFISHAQWKAQKMNGDREVIEYNAGFNFSAEGKDFYYKVLGIYRIDDIGNLKTTREKVYGNEKNDYLKGLENSAYIALTFVEGRDGDQDAQ